MLIKMGKRLHIGQINVNLKHIHLDLKLDMNQGDF